MRLLRYLDVEWEWGLSLKGLISLGIGRLVEGGWCVIRFWGLGNCLMRGLIKGYGEWLCRWLGKEICNVCGCGWMGGYK